MSLNINNINYDDFKNICRVCMLNCDFKFILDCVVSDIFHKLTDLHFETNDHLPKQICRKCSDKIIEIHEFMLQCKRTHSALMECLNKQPNVVQNEGIEKRHELLILDKIVSTKVETNSLNSTDNNQMEIFEETNKELNDDTIQETCEIKEEILENTDLQETCYNLKEELTFEEHKIEFVKSEHVFDEKTEINNDHSINCSEDDLLISNLSNINVKNEETSNDDAILNDLNGDTISSNCSKTSNINCSEKNKKGEEVYKCLQCSKSFSHLSSLKNHVRVHTAKHLFKCKDCSKIFTLSNSLKVHMRSHSGECPYKCEECLKSFTRSNSLKIHMRKHTGERPFKCKHCSKSFTNSYSLKSHMGTHSDERHFKCNGCSKSFTHSSNLKTHMRTHTDERPFKCKCCSKSFAQSWNLKSHMRTHTDERPFKCKECSKSFTLSSSLKRHMLTRHTSDKCGTPFRP